MKLGRLIRKIWHDIFYSLTGVWGDKLAMTCRQATDQNNLDSTANSFRYYLHLSLCQACKNYYDFSKYLKKQSRRPKYSLLSEAELQEFNKKLLLRVRR